MRKVQISRNRKQPKSSRTNGSQAGQQVREVQLPVLNRFRNIRHKSPRQDEGQGGQGDLAFGDSSWSEDEEHTERNVTYPGGPVVYTCRRFLPRTRRSYPISRFVSPPPGDYQFESDPHLSNASLRNRSHTFRSREAIPLEPSHPSSVHPSVQSLSQVSPDLRRVSESSHRELLPSRISRSMRETASASGIPQERSLVAPPPLPYYSLPALDKVKSSSQSLKISQQKPSLPSLPSTTEISQPYQSSVVNLLPPKSSSRQRSSLTTTLSPPPVPSIRKSKVSSTLGLSRQLSSPTPPIVSRSNMKRLPPVPPIPKPRHLGVKLQNSKEADSIEHLFISNKVSSDFEQEHEDQHLVYDDEFHSVEDEFAVKGQYTMEGEHTVECEPSQIPHVSWFPPPCDSFTSPIRRRPLRYRYQEIQPRYTEEPLFWIKSKWDDFCPNVKSWPPDAKTQPTPDFLLNNALRVVRQPKKVPIPKYLDSSTGKIRNWCTSGLARNYIYKPDFGKVPAYLQSSHRGDPSQQLGPQEISSIMNLCHPRDFFNNYFSKI